MDYFKSKFLKLLFITLFISTCSAVFLILSIYYVDNTTYITGNGLYKAVEITRFSKGMHYFDLEHALYTPFMYFFINTLHINLLPGILLSHMAIVNALMGATAIFFLFLLVHDISGNLSWSILLILFHLFSAFFYFLSISTEDILPAYAFFVGSVYFLFKYLRHHNKIWIVFSALLYSISILLHRTMIIGFPAYIISLLLDNIKDVKQLFVHLEKYDKRIIRVFLLKNIVNGIVFTFIFLLVIKLLTAKPHLILRIRLDQSGWSGFSSEKIVFTFFSGIGQSLLIGANQGDIKNILYPSNLVVEIPTLLFMTCIIILLLSRLLSKDKYALYILFLLVNFALAEIINLRTQGQDPQFQLQPLLIIPIGMTILYSGINNKTLKKVMMSGLCFLIIWESSVNLSLANFIKGSDKKNIQEVKRIEHAIEIKNSRFIIHGFDPFLSWSTFLWDNYGVEQLYLGFTTYPVAYPKLTAEETAQKMIKYIEDSVQSGKTVYATDIITLSDDQLLSSMETVDSSGKALIMRKAIISNYDYIKVIDTTYGPFYKLIPKNNYETNQKTAN